MTVNKARILLLLTSIFWGTGFVFMDSALDSLPPLNILAIRFLIASAVMFALCYKRIISEWKISYKSGILIGIALCLGFIFQTYGLMFTTPSKNAFLTATSVVFVPFILLTKYKKKLDIYTMIGSVVMFIGIAFISLDGGLTINIGDMLTIVCGLFFGIHIILVGNRVSKDNLEAIVFIQLLTAGLISLVMSLLTEDFTLIVDQAAIFPLLYVSLVATCVTFFLQNYAMEYVSASETAIILSLEAFFGTIASVIIKGELISTTMMIGFILMFIAILSVETKFKFLRRAT